MALDWVAQDVKNKGTLLKELDKVNLEIEELRLNGRELSFQKEKRTILLLALYKQDSS